MENFIVTIMHVPFICGVLLLAATGIMHIFPSKKINDFYGYRTNASKKSQERWDFAQRYSQISTLKASLALIVVGMLGYILPFSEDIKLVIGIILTPFSAVYIFKTTDRAIEKRFINS